MGFLFQEMRDEVFVNCFVVGYVGIQRASSYPDDHYSWTSSDFQSLLSVVEQ